ncbi:MAG TPA: hypothetical protein VJI97_04625 [Candidatus Nanoarchaeia archaeon]|nr:hypothetical protein [Candidatus Nanoarchaeia archaeon]
MSHDVARCPNCQRSLADNELYCHFCEIDLEKAKKSGHEKEKHGRH